MDDRLRPCKHISLELPSPICIVGLSTRVGGQPNCDSTCFSGCEFFFAIRLYNRNDSHLEYVRFVVLAQRLECCAVQSEDCQFRSKRRAFALVARACEAFLNLRNRNSHLPTNKTVLTHRTSERLATSVSERIFLHFLLNNCLKQNCRLDNLD